MNTNAPLAGTPAVILCGGRGILIEQGGHHRLNKALIDVHGKPLLWWNLLHYAAHGVRDFILAVGSPAEAFHRTLTQTLQAQALAGAADVYGLNIAGQACQIRVVPTGEVASTATRLLKCAPWLQGAENFCLTYSDTLSDVDLGAEMAFHRRTDSVVTLVSAQMPVRFRVLGLRQGEYTVRGFAAKPVLQNAPINGGFYIATHALLSDGYVNADSTAFETEPLEKLASAGKLAAFEHKGAWQHLDCERDLEKLTELARLLEHRHR